MTTADHRHDTDVHGDTAQDPTEYDTSRVSGGYGDASATEDRRGGYGADGDLDGTSADDTDRAEGGYASRHAEDADATGTRTVDVDAGDTTTGTHAAGDGTPMAGGTSTSTNGGTAGGTDLERLVPADRVDEYTSRWDSVKGEFVDEPRQAVAKADKLVGDLLDELDQLFRKQRSDLEHGLDADETSTEDLRLALRKYRSFFDRLLAL